MFLNFNILCLPLREWCYYWSDVIKLMFFSLFWSLYFFLLHCHIYHFGLGLIGERVYTNLNLVEIKV